MKLNGRILTVVVLNQRHSQRIYEPVVCAYKRQQVFSYLTVSSSLSKSVFSSLHYLSTQWLHTGILTLTWQKVTLEHPLTCISGVQIFSQSPPSVATGEFGGSARILRLRVSTTERMPPLRLLIMAHPFPPGSTLWFSPPPIPSLLSPFTSP